MADSLASIPFHGVFWLHLRRRSAFPLLLRQGIIVLMADLLDFAKGANCAFLPFVTGAANVGNPLVLVEQHGQHTPEFSMMR